MPKAASKSTQKEETKVSEAAFLKSVSKLKSDAKTAAKKEKPTGILTDSQILEKLEIAKGDAKTFQATCTKVSMSFAKNDPNRPAFRFNYTIQSSNKAYNGTQVSNYHLIEEGKNKTTGEVFRTMEDTLASLFYEFQGIGYDTASWTDPLVDAVNAAKEITKDKPDVSLTIKHGTDKETKKKSYLNIYVNSIASGNADLQTEDQEEEDGEDGEGTFNAEEWIGAIVEFDNEEYGHVVLTVESYDEDTHTFSGTDSNGEPWEGDYAVSVDDVEWSDQNDE